MPEPRIWILPPEIAEQIAAGEVVERPASAVKELVENALDAGARRITVETEAGGKALIRVTDDGTGMTAEEARLALQRHATSKLRSADDLFDIHTLGFRGEALPSIAAVSEMEILTRTADSPEGALIRVEAGVVREERPAAANVGTQITVRRLFFNVPVREKFLRSDVAEGGHITDWLQRLALAHPEVTFRLVHDGREALLSPGTRDALNAVVSILGRGVARDLLRIPEAEASGTGIQVTGFVGRPTLTRSSRALQHTYVNGRAVRTSILYRALDDAFRSSMPSGRYPVAVLFLTLPPGAVDVNVHPAKTEVRFQDEGAVHQALLRAIQAALRTQAPETQPLPGYEVTGAPTPSRVAEPPRTPYAELSPPSTFAEAALAPPPRLTPREAGGPRPPAWAPTPQPERDPFAEPAKAEAPAGPPREAPAETVAGPAESQAEAPASGRASEPESSAIPELAYLGQSQDLFILAAGGDQLWIIDQHVAHERVLFDRLTAPESRREPSEALLIPVSIEVDRPRALALEEHRGLLDELGFVVEAFGPGRCVLRAVPRSLIGRNYEQVFHDLADELAEQSQGGQYRLRKEEVAMAAAGRSCKSAVKAGQKLSTVEIEQLLSDLRTARNPHTCPHGRPVFLTYSEDEIARLFGGVSCG